MKTTLRLFALAASLCFASSCSESTSDDPVPTPSSELVGSWQMSSRSVTTYTSTGAVANMSQSAVTPGIMMQITATQITPYQGATPTTYTRRGNRIYVAPDTAAALIITGLSAHQLVWTSVVDGSTGPHPAINTITYTR